MKKRLLTYLSMLIIMMMVPIGAKALDPVTVYYSIPTSVLGSNTLKCYAKFGNETGQSSFGVMTNTGKTYKGNPVYSYSFTAVYGDKPYGGVDQLYFQLFDTNDKWVSQIGYSSWTSCNSFVGKIFVTEDGSNFSLAEYNEDTPTPTTKTYSLLDNTGYALVSEDADGNFEYTPTSDKQVYFKIGSTNYYVPNATTATDGTVTATLKAQSQVNNYLTLKSGYKYTFNISSNNGLTVTGVKTGDTPTPTPTPTTSSDNFYLVTNFVGGTTGSNGDGGSINVTRDINYNRLIFKFSKQKDGSYSIDIPATLTGYAQVLATSKDGGKTVYGPNAGTDVNGWSVNSGSINETGKTDQDMADGSTTLTKGTSYWNFSSQNSTYQADGGLNNDGMYTISFKLGSDGKPASWSINYNKMKRVAYVLSTKAGALAQPVYDARKNTGSAFDNKFLGNVYIDANQTYQVLSNYLNPYSESVGAASDHGFNKGGNQSNPTIDQLILQGNGSQTWQQANERNLVYANDGTFNPDASVTETGSYILEYNPSKGKDQARDNYGLGGEIWLFQGAGMNGIKSVSMVGTAVDGTVTDGKWDYTSPVGDMQYDEDGGYYYLKLTTTAADGETHFRFVANHSAVTTWYEDGTPAKTPYNGNGTGSAATEEDPNNVSFATSNNTDDETLNIIFNRPAGEWTVKFYIKAENKGDHQLGTTYYYTIEGTPSAAPAVSLSPASKTISGSEAPLQQDLDVTVANGTQYIYGVAAGSTRPTLTYNASDVKTVGKAGTAEDFGTLKFTTDANGSKVTLTPVSGSASSVDGSSITIALRPVVDGAFKGSTVYYTYNFAITGGESNVEFDPAKGGLFINKRKVTIKFTGTPDFEKIHYALGGKTATAESPLLSEAPGFTPDKVNPACTITISTPGKISIFDEATSTETTSEKFDFTYSTTENYANYYNNGTTSQTVNTNGGKDAITFFVQDASDKGDLNIYAWDYTYDLYLQNSKSYNNDKRDPLVKLTSVYPGQMLGDFNTTVLNGVTYYYYTTQLSQLKHAGDKDDANATISGGNYNNKAVGFIVNSYKYTEGTPLTKAETAKADKYKTMDESDIQKNSFYVFTSSSENAYTPGDDGTITVTTYNNKLDGVKFQTYSQYMANATEANKSDLVDAKNVVFFNNSNNAISGTVYCYAYNNSTNNTWPGVAMTQIGSSNIWYYVLGEDSKYTNLIFTDGKQSDATQYPGANSDGFKVMQGGVYDSKTSAGSRPYTIYFDKESSDRYETFMKKPAQTTVVSTKYPNGIDYYNNMPSDMTLLLDPTWGGKISKEVAGEETSIAHWSGTPASGNQTVGYRKIVDTAKVPTLSQTIYSLDPSAEYTVQAVVRVQNPNKSVTLDVNGTKDTYTETQSQGTRGCINKWGRVEYLDLTEFTGSDKTVDLQKIQGATWAKVEAKAKPTSNGALTISLTSTDSKYDLADVTLFENANTAGRYWTTAPTSSTVTEFDLSDRTRANAFSFFDRGKNRNAVIYANSKTVIGLKAGTLSADRDYTLDPDADAEHMHPIDVAAAGDDNTFAMRRLSLTDFDDDDTYTFDNVNTYGTTKNYTFDEFEYDRNYTTGINTTMVLPFDVTKEQVKTMLGTDKIYTLKGLTKQTLTFESQDKVAANTPFMFRPANASLDGTTIKGSAVASKNVDGDNVATMTAADPQNGDNQFVGVYKFTSFFDLYNANKQNDYYIYRAEAKSEGGKLEQGEFGWAIKGSSVPTSARIKPFRAYFVIANAGNNGAKKIAVSFVDKTSTGIESVDAEKTSLNGNIYTIDGRLVSRDGSTVGLQKGIYIQNGRKFVVR